MSGRPSIVVVLGATASGKSDFAQQLALERNGEIINADSQQFYRGLDIGTGKLPQAERKVPHGLLDICEPGQSMTAGEFARRADDCIADLIQKNKIPIVVGGTGLYIRALLEGLDDLPKRDPALREKLSRDFERVGGEGLHQRLKEVDPQSAAKISPNDPSRLIRYLEIYTLTGKPPSTLLKKKELHQLRYLTKTYWLHTPREVLRERIALRVRQMIAQGWVEEVRALVARGIDFASLPNKPIGYADLAKVVDGDEELESAVERIIQKTRQYAKRQETFFRGLLKQVAYQLEGSAIEILRGAPK